MTKLNVFARGIAAYILVGVVLAAIPSRPAAGAEREPYIVVLRQSVSDPAAMMDEIDRDYGLTPRHVYRAALNGFAADLPPRAVKALSRSKRVALLEPDRVARRRSKHCRPVSTGSMPISTRPRGSMASTNGSTCRSRCSTPVSVPMPICGSWVVWTACRTTASRPTPTTTGTGRLWPASSARWTTGATSSASRPACRSIRSRCSTRQRRGQWSDFSVASTG